MSSTFLASLPSHSKAKRTMAGPDKKDKPIAVGRELSNVSKRYDFDGDGVLDEVEQAL